MGNEYFKADHDPEKYEEFFERYRILTSDELKALSVSKSRIFVSVADMDLILDALELLIEEGTGHGREVNKRRVMQMGLSLQEIKQRLQKRIDKESGRDSS